MEDIVIVSAARTAVGKFGGSLAKTPATELGAIVIKALLRASTGLERRPGGRSHHGPGAGRRRGPEPGAPGGDQGRPAQGVPGLTINARCAARA
jgi:acetyl-CoA C-acetyltransferase